MSEKSTTIFIVVPDTYRNSIPINIDKGIAIPTNDALRNPRKNSNTRITKITPEIILFSRLLTSFRVFTD